MAKAREETKHIPTSKIRRDWYLLDASRFRLGRLATIVANLLIGKHKPIYSPHLDVGDSVVIINASKIKVSGDKKEEKIYYRHTGYIGHLKEERLKYLLKKSPEKVIFRAVKNMLPKNRLQKERLKRIKIFKSEKFNLKINFKEYKDLEIKS